MQVYKVQNQTTFNAKLGLSGDTMLLKPSEIKALAKKAEKIAGENDMINFHIQYLDWDMKTIPVKDGKDDVVTTFSRQILANHNINNIESKQKNITPFLTEETHNCKWLPQNSILNKPFDYIDKYLDKLSEKFKTTQQ